MLQVPETVYEDKMVCTHRLERKCHQTYITDYSPTQVLHCTDSTLHCTALQERTCQTSYRKKCRISYKPTVTTETVSVCRDSLEKQCSNTTVGETLCRTVYQTTCNTRYREVTVREDAPVCREEVERQCETVAGPAGEGSGEPLCTEWPVQKVAPVHFTERWELLRNLINFLL